MTNAVALSLQARGRSRSTPDWEKVARRSLFTAALCVVSVVTACCLENKSRPKAGLPSLTDRTPLDPETSPSTGQVPLGRHFPPPAFEARSTHEGPGLTGCMDPNERRDLAGEVVRIDQPEHIVAWWSDGGVWWRGDLECGSCLGERYPDIPLVSVERMGC